MKKKINKKKIDNRENLDITKKFSKVKTGINENNVFVYTEILPLNKFAELLNKPAAEIIKYFFLKGKSYSINSLLTEEEMGEVCLEYNYDFEKKTQVDEYNFFEHLEIDKNSKLVKRPPVVTIMGHVDHGKTTLLDAIRKSRITASEYGGITQHIGAYQVTYKGSKITFLDTPGHEIFTQMRARGANITDIVILVVAADDGIKPQTEEAIDHAKAAKVPIIVFINKIDKPGVNVDNVMNQLVSKGLTPEEWGGDTIIVKGSALKNKNIDKLLEVIITLSEMLELKANSNCLGSGTIIEANLDKGLGPCATILVQNGIARKSDFIIVEDVYGKIRLMLDDFNNEVQEVTPGQPAKIIGLSDVPAPGSKWVILKDEKLAKDLAKKIKEKRINIDRLKAKKTSEEINDDNSKHLNLIIKCDVRGSLEAIKSMIENIQIEGIKITIIRAAIGQISETDIQLASATRAKIIGFNIKPTGKIRNLANEHEIKVYFYNVVYKLKDDIILILKGMLDPIIEEKILGEAEARQLWRHSKVGTIIGAMVLSGKITKNAKVRVIRDGQVIYTSKIASLHHLKNTINEVIAGKECGLVIADFNDIKVNDIIQAFEEIKVSLIDQEKKDK